MTKRQAAYYTADFATVGAPFVALIGPLGPTCFPDAAIASLCSLLNGVCHLVFYGQFGDGPRRSVRRAKRLRKWVFGFFLGSLGLSALLSIVFVGDFKGRRFTRGLILSDEGKQYLKEETKKQDGFARSEIDSAIADAELDPYKIYRPWSVDLVQYSMLVLWVAIFILICFLWSIYKYLYPDVPVGTGGASASDGR